MNRDLNFLTCLSVIDTCMIDSDHVTCLIDVCSSNRRTDLTSPSQMSVKYYNPLNDIQYDDKNHTNSREKINHFRTRKNTFNSKVPLCVNSEFPQKCITSSSPKRSFRLYPLISRIYFCFLLSVSFVFFVKKLSETTSMNVFL